MKFRAREVENPAGRKQERKRALLFLPLFLVLLLLFPIARRKAFLSLSLIAPPTHKSPPLFAKKPFPFSSPLPPPIENDDTLFPASRSRGLAINYPSLLSFPPPFFNFLERRNLPPSPLWPLPAHEMDPSRNNGNRKVELVSNTRNFSVRSRTQERGKIKLMNDRSLHF